MADFEHAFNRLMHEEGIVLTNDPTDRGGQTYAGISRKYHPTWAGWKYIDAGETPPTALVREFYQEKYWEPIRGSDIASQAVAEVIFSQYVNMGGAAIKLVQATVGTIPDGKLGPKTLEAVNAADSELFLMMFALANLKRYHEIGMRDKSQRKFWPGWFARGLRICQ